MQAVSGGPGGRGDVRVLTRSFVSSFYRFFVLSFLRVGLNLIETTHKRPEGGRGLRESEPSDAYGLKLFSVTGAD